MSAKRLTTVVGFTMVVWLMALVLVACGDENVTITNPASTTTVPTQTINPVATTNPATSATTTTAPAFATDAPATTAPVTSAPVATTVAAPATTAAATVAPATTSAPTPTASSSTFKSGAANIVYNKDGTLYVYDFAKGQSVAALKNKSVLRFKLSPDQQKVAVLAHDDKTITLELMELSQNLKVTTLDNSVGTFYPATDDKPFAVYQRAYTLDFSPDGKRIAYAKANPQGPDINSFGFEVKPTEIWLSDVSGGASPRKIAPNNEAKFFYNPTYSPDGERVAFVRIDYFATDVSGLAELWSVHTDGTKLTQLAAPDAPGGNETRLITQLQWTGPLAIGFIVTGLEGAALWSHDLSTAKARQLSPALISNTLYDATSQRYAFQNDQGLFTTGTSSQAAAVRITQNSQQVLAYSQSRVVYVNNQKQVISQALKSDGTSGGAAITLPLPAEATKTASIDATLSPQKNGPLVISYYTESQNVQVLVFDANGKPLNTTAFNSLSGQTHWLNPTTLAFYADKKLQVLDLSGPTPAFKTLDTGQEFIQGPQYSEYGE